MESVRLPFYPVDCGNTYYYHRLVSDPGIIYGLAVFNRG